MTESTGKFTSDKRVIKYWCSSGCGISPRRVAIRDYTAAATIVYPTRRFRQAN